MGYWEKGHRGKVPFASHHATGYVLSMSLITIDVNLDHLVEEVFPTFLLCKLLPPAPLHNVPFGRNSLVYSPQIRV